MKKGFYSIQFLMSVMIFILVLFAVILTLLLKTEFFFKAIDEKNYYAGAVTASTLFNKVLYDEPSLTLNISTFKLIENCSIASADPAKGIHNNFYYDTIKSFLQLDDRNFLSIFVSEYLILTTDKKISATKRKGNFNQTIDFYIEREDIYSLYTNLTLGSNSYVVGDIVDFNGQQYKLDYINGRTGTFAILKRELMRCGMNPKAHLTKSLVFYRYAPYFNALYEFKVVLW
ncbi:MAG: hypothetical protein GXN99_02885 [Candidatus Nanohaloarchaeota archaeon]|nr:hypothetical protein [Candidatus Nanohaloarchaeota archaeon]